MLQRPQQRPRWPGLSEWSQWVPSEQGHVEQQNLQSYPGLGPSRQNDCTAWLRGGRQAAGESGNDPLQRPKRKV